MHLSDLPKTFQIIKGDQGDNVKHYEAVSWPIGLVRVKSEGLVGETKRHTLQVCGVVGRGISAFCCVYLTYSGKAKR